MVPTPTLGTCMLPSVVASSGALLSSLVVDPAAGTWRVDWTARFSITIDMVGVILRCFLGNEFSMRLLDDPRKAFDDDALLGAGATKASAAVADAANRKTMSPFVMFMANALLCP